MDSKEPAGASFDDLMQIINGFQESRILLTALELDIFTAINAGASAAQVAEKLRLNVRGTELLLNALVAMGVLSKSGGVFLNMPVTSRYFIEGSPDNARPGLLHTVDLWHSWSELTEAVRLGASRDVKTTLERDEDWTRNFIAAMELHSRARAATVVHAVPVDQIRRMLDVGGGSGVYAIAFAQANPGLHADILDVPEVTPITQSYVESAGLTDRIKLKTGDLRSDQFGTGYDMVFVSQICHMLSPEENKDLLRRCSEALAPNGQLVVQDFLLSADKTAPKPGALFSLNMLVNTSSGSNYSVDEYAEWMRQAGLVEVRQVSVPGPAGLIIGMRR